MSFPLQHPDDERFYIENVEPLIVNVEQQGRSLDFKFRCPLTEYEISARVEPGARPGQQESKPGLYGLLETALRGPAAAPRSKLEATSADYTVEEIEEAACDAFESVSQEFIWDGTRWAHWEAEDKVIDFLTYSEVITEFEPQHRKVLRKVLEAVARADGVIEDSEQRLLHSLLGSEGEGQETGQLPGAEELRAFKTRQQACALVCFGYAVACVDGELSTTEEDILTLICDSLGLSTLKQWELKRVAQAFVIDEAFSKIAGEEMASNEERLEVYKLGKGLGLSISDIRELEWRFLKRAGF